MKRRRTHVEYLLDILHNAEKAKRFVEGVTQEDFEANSDKRKRQPSPVALSRTTDTTADGRIENGSRYSNEL
jgi:hypothetical protein